MKKYFALALFFIVGTSHAAWFQANGKVIQVLVYSNTDTVLLKLDTGGTPTSGCADATMFAVDGAVSADRRKQLVSILLAAQARDATVSVSYLDVGGCIPWDGSPNIYRTVARLIAN